MRKRLLRNLYPVLMVTTGIVLALVSAASSSNMHAAFSLPAASVVQVITPTPTAEAVSHPGSTDGIMIMSIVIVVIVLLPLIFRRSLWKK